MEFSFPILGLFQASLMHKIIENCHETASSNILKTVGDFCFTARTLPVVESCLLDNLTVAELMVDI
ncbi:hypothetical protein QQP08_005338 [Theobroma cacao]|nr:hypothetical protein QQP08_005338 [Theobroma cacao]